MNPATISLTLIALYFLLIAVVVFKNPMPKVNLEEFAVAGRSFGWILVSFTILGTWYTGSVYLGFTQMAMDHGIIGLYAAFYTLLSLVVLYLISRPIYIWGQKHNLITQADLVHHRFRYKPLKHLTAVAGLVIEFPWLITELIVIGYALHLASYGAISFNAAMVIGTVVLTAYVVYSGMRSVVWTDLIQGIVMVFGGLGAFIFFAYHFFGGFGPMFLSLIETAPENLTLPGGGWEVDPGPLFWPSIIIAGGLGGYAWPSLFTRIYAADSVKSLKKMVFIAPLVAGVYLTIMLWVGGLGARLIPAVREADFETGLFVMAELAGGPVLLFLICIVVMSAAMTMMNSCYNVFSVIISNDIIKEFKPQLESSTLAQLSRLFCVILAFGALFLAMQELPTLVQLIMLMYQGIIQILPAVLLGSIWRKGNRYGAFWGMIAGLLITIGLSFAGLEFIPFLGGMQAGILGLMVNLAIYIGFAIALPEDPWVEELFDEIKPSA